MDFEHYMHKGKISKCAVIREVLEEGPELKEDWNRLLACAKARFNTIPANLRKGMAVQTHDIDNVINKKSKRSKQGAIARKLRAMKNKAAPSVAQVTKPEQGTSSNHSYAYNELTFARRLLSACGDSITRSHEVIALVSDLGSTKTE